VNGSLADGALVPRAAAAFALLARGPARRQLGRRGLENAGEEAARPLVRLIADNPLGPDRPQPRRRPRRRPDR
jgi:hypothetical protein